MLVSRIEPLDKRRSKVFLDGDFAFVLYHGEIFQYRMKEGEELEEAVYEELLWQAVAHRAREKAFALLKVRGRTEYELRTRLRTAWFPEIIIEETVRFLKEYRYLDDEAYARNYAEVYGEKKSRAELEQDLRKKGVDRALIQEICRNQDTDSRKAVAAIMRKRGCTEQSSFPERQKTIAYLLRRGFSWEEIRAASGCLAGLEDL